MVEIWKDIDGFEGFYQVSNLGRVKSLARVVNDYRGTGKHNKERILKPKRKNVANSYLTVCFSKYGTITTHQIHTLVARAFLGNPDAGQEVNHKNGVKGDNRVENLEWVSRRENIMHASRVLGYKNVPVKCVETGQVFISQTVAAEWCGNDSANICVATKRPTRTAGGYHWERAKI